MNPMTKAGEQPTIKQAAIDAICSKFDSYTLDWDHSRQYDGEEPRVIPTCGELREARQIILALSEAVNTRTTSLAAQDNYVDATYLRECWNNCLGMDVSDWAHDNVPDMLDAIERQAKEIVSLRDYITTAPPAPPLAAQDGLAEAVADALLSAFLAGRGSITARERNAHKPEPSMEHFRSIALSAIKGDKS